MRTILIPRLQLMREFSVETLEQGDGKDSSVRLNHAGIDDERTPRLPRQAISIWQLYTPTARFCASTQLIASFQ